jgi:hypothetical protein
MVKRWSELPASDQTFHAIVTDREVYGRAGEIQALLHRLDRA